MLRRLHSILAVGAAFAALSAAGCAGEAETKPLDTKDLPPEMKTPSNAPPVQPSGNQFKNPRDAGGARQPAGR